MKNAKQLKRGLGWLTLAILLSLGTAQAQLNRGIMEGIVTDPQGAAVVGARVTITDLATNVTAVTKTNDTGYYRVVDLVPGKYSAHIESSGFVAVEIVGIQVPAGETIREDAQMKLGATHQLVQVTASAPLVETGASNFSTAIDNRTVQDVPLQGRDLQQLIYLLPGVSSAAGPPGSNFGFNSQFGSFPDPTYVQGSDVSVNGGQGGANAWYLDGMINLSGMAENVAVNPSPDAVGEFQAITNGFAPQYSRTGGGVFDVVLKSGTNQLHGNLYEYVRNSATNARNPFTSIDATGHIIPQDQLRYNDFGGTLGGPVVIPHVYNGKDKTFFFVSFEHTILHLSGSQVFSVPTPAMRQGNFAEDPNSTNFGIWNPYSTVGPNSSGLFTRTAFGTPVAGNPYGANGCLNTSVEAGSAKGIKTCNFATTIPSNMMDKSAMFFLNSYPLPNFVDPLSNCPMGKGNYRICDNYLGSVGSSQNPYNISIKVDNQWSDRSKYFAEWVFNPGQYNNYQLPWTGPTFPSTGWGASLPFDFANQVAGFGNTYILSPTFFNEFHASFSRQFLTTNPSQGGYPNSVSDLSQVNQVLGPSQIFVGTFTASPSFSVGMPDGGSSSFGPPGWVNMLMATESYTILDDVTKIVGRHTIKTGFVYRLEHAGRSISDPTTLAFDGRLTGDPNTGLGAPGLTQFMMGTVSSDGASATGLTADPYLRDSYWGFYVQDDFRITPKFTLNMGLRYDIPGFFQTREGPMSNFCLSCPNSYTGRPGKMIYWGDPGFPWGSNIAPANKTDFGPRLNFSWAPWSDRKTVFRGGYDIFYTNATNSYNNIGQGIAPGPDWQSFNIWNGSFYPGQCAPFSGQCVAFPLSNTTVVKGNLTTPPVPADHLPPAAHEVPGYASQLQFYYPPPADPMEESWNFNIQRELPDDMMIEVGYVGTHGVHLAGDTFRQFNYVHTADRVKYKTGINANVPITQIYSGQTATALQQIWGSSTLPLSILLTDYPAYGALFPQTVFDGTSVYNALDVRFQKRFSHGMNFIVSYTNSKEIDNASTAQLAAMTFDTIHLSRPGNIGGRIGAQGGGAASGVSGVFGGGYQNPDNRNADRAIAIDDIPQNFNATFTYELPFGAGKHFLNEKGPLNAIFGGWLLTGNLNAESGTPLTITGPCDQLTCRPDLIGNPRMSGSKQAQINDWINASAFTPPYGADQTFWQNYNPNDPRAYLFGTAGLRLPSLRGPGFWNLDSALAKDFHVSETKYFQFRWEAFNTLNHMNPGLPNTNYCLPPGPGGETDTVHQAGCQFGRITNIQTDPRSMQFALKFYW